MQAFKLITTRNNDFNSWYRRIGKRFFDYCASLFLLVAMFPLMMLTGLAIRVTLGKGVIFVQHRVGLNGILFQCFKFRTMGHDLRKNNSAGFVPERRKGIPSANDPRHCKFGRFLRRFCIDEMPQLFNVLRGDMSLVGPRPEIAEVSLCYNEKERQRFSVKPGMTGYWQVTCRSEAVDLRMHVDKDIDYANNISILNDIRIILRTPYSMLFLPAATEIQRGINR